MNLYNLLLNKAKDDGIIKNVVGAVIVNDDKVLVLTRKQDDFMGGIDELPSGNLEPNESIYDALIREVKEETNLDLESVLSFINTFDYLSSSGKKTRQYNFAIKVKNIDNILLTEHDSYKWEQLSSIKNNPNITNEVKYTLEIYMFNNK